MLYAEMTQGDPFYYEIAFIDAYGAPVPLAGWGVQCDFKLAFNDALALFSLTLDNDGIGYINADPTAGVIYLQFDADSVADVAINMRQRNGVSVPSRTIIGDIKLIPPDGVELVQGTGPRTSLFLKINAGVTA